MARKPQPQQPSNNDGPTSRPDVDDFISPMTHSAGGETFDHKDEERRDA
jgi:hypothetical protein